MKKIILIISAMILILSFSKVKADTLADAIWATYYSDPLKQNTLSSNGDYYQYIQPSVGTGNNMVYSLIYFNPSVPLSSYFDYVSIPFTITGRQFTNDSDYVDREVVCDWDYEEVAGGGYTASAYDCHWYASGTYSSPAPINLTIDVSLSSTTSQAQSPCKLESSKLICPLARGVNFDTIVFNYSLTNQNTNYPIRFNFGHIIGKYQSAEDRQQQAIEGVQQQQQQTNEYLNQTQEYNNQTNTNTIGANETLQAGAMEDQLIQENEFNGSILDGMSINSGASGFIWQIMERLREMNVAIVSLMTMALGLGVIKLVLNR